MWKCMSLYSVMIAICESSIPGSSGESIVFIFAMTATCCLHVHVKDCKVRLCSKNHHPI